MTKYDLCSRALLKCGANTITSFTDGTAEAEIAAGLYDAVRDALLSAHPWSFATAQARLACLAAPPLVDLAYAYQLPSDFLRVLSLGESRLEAGRGLPYRLQGDQIHTHAAGVVLSYIFAAAESTFPPFFAEALVARLAAEFSLPVTENTARTQALFQLAEVAYRRARLTDSQQHTPAALEDFTLLRARQSSPLEAKDRGW